MEKIKRKYLLTLNQNKPNSISPNTTQKKLEDKPGYPLQILIEMLHLAFTSGQKRKHIYKLLIACDSLTPSKPSNTYSKCTAGRAFRSIKTCIQNTGHYMPVDHRDFLSGYIWSVYECMNLNHSLAGKDRSGFGGDPADGCKSASFSNSVLSSGKNIWIPCLCQLCFCNFTCNIFCKHFW